MVAVIILQNVRRTLHAGASDVCGILCDRSHLLNNRVGGTRLLQEQTVCVIIGCWTGRGTYLRGEVLIVVKVTLRWILPSYYFCIDADNAPQSTSGIYMLLSYWVLVWGCSGCSAMIH